ncbi:MAG TPA: hypothetical protein VJJ79_01820 [Candidatus Nanoarchaeia archaeon]|nr:hypothetical protein [Candidatus Nanoarchaeia archaeon]
MVEDTVTYVCTMCRFRFRRGAKWSHPLCPNCGKEWCYEREDTVNKLINESL